jgi:hypothetical protein
VYQLKQCNTLLWKQFKRKFITRADMKRHPSLNPLYRFQSTMESNVRGFG